MYEWALETMQCLRTVKVNKKQSAVDAAAHLCRVQQFVDVHPSPLNVPVENHVNDMLVKINDLALNEKWRTARQRYTRHIHCIGLLRSE